MKLKYVFSSLGILICLSVFADGVKPAKVGEQSPDFQFADKNGKMYSLKDGFLSCTVMTLQLFLDIFY